MQDAAASIARIDPAQCRLPPGRLPIAPSECAHLIDSIRAHGQLVPGLVRRTPPGDPVRYEIICGARRHFAITTLGQNRPFFAAIRPLSDEAAFAAADRENRHRTDISDLQRALDYSFALDRHYAGNQAHMARAIHINPTALSRYLSLANVPADIFVAFGHPARLTMAMARQLFPHLKNEPAHDRILQAARAIATAQQQRAVQGHALISPETVLRRLLQPEATIRPTHTVTTADGTTLARGERRPNGAIHITITPQQERAKVLAATAEILDNLCATEKGWQQPTLCDTTTIRHAA